MPKDRLPQYISTSAFADMMKCHESTVRKAIKEDRISEDCLRRNGNGRLNGIDWAKAKIEWARNYSIGNNPSSPVAESLTAEVITGTRGDSGDIKDVAESKRLQEHYKAELARIELEEKEKKLVYRDLVRKDLYGFGNEVKLALQAVPDAVADAVAIEDDRNKCYKIVLKEINDALRKLTEVVERDFG